jgi:hypothetical protein
VILALLGLTLVALAYGFYPWLCRRSATRDEGKVLLPGDDLVPRALAGYTLAVSIAAPPSAVWPWLVQMGQGRGGFYTHEWVERLLAADIHNADRVVPELQSLAVGDLIRLTPDPYLGRPGQAMRVTALERERALALAQTLPNGAVTSSAYLLRAAGGGTRLVFRRRSARPSAFDRVMLPGYYYMDMGMLEGVRRRAERLARRST